MVTEVPVIPATAGVVPEAIVKTVVVPLSKPMWKSWTLIINILSGIIVVLNQVSPFTDILFRDPTTAKNVSDLISALLVMLNILLRFKTDSQVNLGFKIVKA